MKPLWLGGITGQDNSELEVLQTDIMRFVAILGLCLAAIFSLVHTASVEQASIGETPESVPEPVSETAPEPVTEPIPEAIPEPVPESQPEAVPETAPPPTTLAPPDEDTGYSLGFASVAALQSLLQRGEVHLYAFGSQSHYRYRPKANRFTASTAPAQYYLMQSETVPGQLQRQLARVTDLSAITWGVVLPQHTVMALSGFLEKSGGGELLIDTTGAVSLAGT